MENRRNSGTLTQENGNSAPVLPVGVGHFGHYGYSHAPESRSSQSGFEACGPPLKRPRTEDLGDAPNNAPAENHACTSEFSSSGTHRDILNSTEWMRARIAQLEAELDKANAARDMAVSEQEVIRTAHIAERTARREAMSQKSAAEAALSRKEAEQDRLRADLETALAQKATLSIEAEALRQQIETAIFHPRRAQPTSDNPPSYSERNKALELELEEVRDQMHKLRIQKSLLEQHAPNLETGQPKETKAKIEDLKSQVKQLKSDLATTQEDLASTQKSLGSMERKYSMARGKYQSTKAKAGVYKERLNNERALLRTLKTTLTPATYQSLGTIHETMGALLSAMALPPVNEGKKPRLKEESE